MAPPTMPRLPAIPLRTRVTLLYTLLGLVMSLLFAGMVTFIAEDYERVLVEEILRSQADDYVKQLQEHPDAALPRSHRLSAYLRRKDGSGEVPDALAALAPGIHESPREDEDGLHTAVFDTAVGRLYFSIDLMDIERLERHMQRILIAVVACGTLLSAWLGWLLSGAVVRPVRRLADAVDGLPVQPRPTALAVGLPHDELGRLGKAIDDYQARLVASEQSERAFFADASHELRTPISVVRGAAELLQEDGADMPQLAPRLQRLDRGLQQLSELLEALLGLARRRVGPLESVDLEEWLIRSLGGLDLVRDGAVRVSVSGARQHRELPTREAELVLRGVVRQLVPAGACGSLSVNAGDRAMELRFIDDAAPVGAAMSPSPGSSDRRFGMTLIGRLAAQIGWELDDSGAEGQRVVIRFTKTG
jgi:hypothetical protein